MRVPAVRLPGQPGDPESPSPSAPPRWGAGVCANTDTLTPSPTPQDHNVGGCLTAPVRARRDPLTLPTPLGSPVTDTVARCREPSSRPLAAGRGRGTPPAWWGLPRLPHTSRGQRRACPAWEAHAPHRTAALHRAMLDHRTDRGRPAARPPPPSISAADRKRRPFPGGAQPW